MALRALSVKMLTLAINWDRMDIAVALLDKQEVSDKSNLLVVRALQRALALRRAKFVQMLLTLPTISTMQVHMCPLYASLPSRLTHADAALKARMDEQIHHFEDNTKGEARVARTLGHLIIRGCSCATATDCSAHSIDRRRRLCLPLQAVPAGLRAVPL